MITTPRCKYQRATALVLAPSCNHQRAAALVATTIAPGVPENPTVVLHKHRDIPLHDKGYVTAADASTETQKAIEQWPAARSVQNFIGVIGMCQARGQATFAVSICIHLLLIRPHHIPTDKQANAKAQVLSNDADNCNQFKC